MSADRPEFPHRPHFAPVPVAWQTACGDLITSWAPVEFALHLIVLRLRWHLKIPPSKTDSASYDNAPKVLAAMAKEARDNLKRIPELAPEAQALEAWSAEARPLMKLRNAVVHGHFSHTNLQGQYVLYHPSPNTRFVYRERRLSLSEIHSAASAIRKLAESISDISEGISYKIR